MAIHPDFPTSPYSILEPEIRWLPADESFHDASYEKLMPPMVHLLRKEVKKWRDNNYKDASQTSKALLQWWFQTEHLIPQNDGTTKPFRYYFAQQEAVETVIYLYDVASVKDKYDMLRFDSSNFAQSLYDKEEDWRRFVIKMATGSGKTKVLSLLLAWSFFHKLYEEDSDLSRNFLLIAPNIIVLDRLLNDFNGLKIFFEDPILPDNGYEGQNWQDDFQLTLHVQDDVSIVRKTGNIFLTNIHRVYSSDDSEPSFQDDNTIDYFLGPKPTGKTTDSKTDLGLIVRDIDELVVLNDEAHHIHDSRLAWFKSIEDIHNKLKQKDKFLSLQVDVTATPKHNNGAIFVQTVSDYPLVEAISQNVVKHPVLPDKESRDKLVEKKSSIFTEKYDDYINLGVEEWRKVYHEHEKLGKKAILFVMTDDTQNCDDVADYLEKSYPEFKDAVLTIHTKNNGEISEADNKKAKEELENLREQANRIDSWESPYRAIVSVLMLKEGWDVKNVTTIVGLRAYSAKSNILPEQTLGRGLRRMYFGSDIEEYVSIVGTDAFMDFVESIQDEGVELEHKPMGIGSEPKAPLIVEIDREDKSKDLEKFDIKIPVLTPRVYRDYNDLSALDTENFSNRRIEYKDYTDEEKRNIVFRDIATNEVNHITYLDSATAIDYHNVVGYFAKTIMEDLRLFSGYDILYGKVKEYIINHLFDVKVDLDDLNTIRNLSELSVVKTIIESFKKKINELTIKDKRISEIKDYIRLLNTRPFVVKDQGYFKPSKSVFNKIIGDSHLELEFANFLDNCGDITSYTKNFLAVHFNIDYINSKGYPANYYPDFLIKVKENQVIIAETKGLEDLDVPRKMQRLKQWCEDVNSVQSEIHFDFVYVDEENFHDYKPRNMKELIENFKEYKDV